MTTDIVSVVREPRKLLAALLRYDFRAFVEKVFATVAPGDQLVWTWHLDAMAYELTRVENGDVRRLVINLPPRHLKSILVSVAWPAWLLGHDPGKRIIVASYSQELAAKHANDFRKVVTSDWYRAAFPGFRIDSKNTESEVQTTAGGGRLAVSVGGSLTGRGGDLIIIDDPLKADEALSKERRERVNTWFDSTLLSRLNNKRSGRIVLVMQRLHVNDLSGHVLGKGGWTHLSLPAIAQRLEQICVGPHGEMHKRQPGDVLDPEREPRAVLDQIRAELGSNPFSAQYLQEPVPPEGAMVRKNWFRYYPHGPGAKSGDIIVQSWDTAYKPGEQNDYSACTTWLVRAGYHEAYLLHVWRGRVDFPTLAKKVVELGEHYDADLILVEDAGSGTSLIQYLKDERFPVKAVKPVGDKVTRLSTGSALIEGGHILLPQRPNDWLDDLLAEVLAFPEGSNDDQVDSLSQFLAWLQERRRTPIIYTRYTF